MAKTLERVMTDEKFVDIDGIRTRYFEKGAGEPLVLIHGNHFGAHIDANHSTVWDLNFDDLAASFRVFAVDKLGQGLTDNPKSDDDYTIGSVVRHIHGFLAAIGVGDVHIVGQSRGAYPACRVTLEHPEIIKTCTLIDTSTCSPGEGNQGTVFANPPEPLLSRHSIHEIMSRLAYDPLTISDEWLDAQVAVAQLPKYQEAVAKMFEQGLNQSQFLPSLAKDKEEMFGWMREKGMQRPTQVMWGYNDPTATLEQGRALFDMIALREPRAQMHVLNHAGHFSFREQPKAFSGLLRNFIANY